MIRSAFIAAVFDQDHPLNKVLMEGGGIMTLVNLQSDWKCFPIYKANIETIREIFSTDDHSQIQIFHFSGHAFDTGLQINDALGGMAQLAEKAAASYLVDPGGLASMIKTIHDVQLVFLNGCSTKNQVDKFINAGIPAVIYTNHPLIDRIGQRFAQVFYQSFFEFGATLENSVSLAITDIESVKNNLPEGVINKDLRDKMRGGGLNLNPDDDGPLYELAASEEFKKKKLADWPAPPDNRDKGVARSTSTFLIPKETALLCNRKKQKELFNDALDGIFSENPSEEPFFFFIHDLDKSCPLSLTKRFELFDRMTFLKDSKLPEDQLEWRQVELPETRHIRDKALCLERLKEIYGKILNSEIRTDTIINLSPKVIAYHDLNNLEMECDDDFKNLLRIYVEDFTPIMAREFSSCKIVLFSIEYYDKNSPFNLFFKELAEQHPGRVFNLTGLSPVKKQHVGNWLLKVFKDKPDPPTVQDIFESLDTSDSAVMMYDMENALEDTLKKYNEKLKT